MRMRGRRIALAGLVAFATAVGGCSDSEHATIPAATATPPLPSPTHSSTAVATATDSPTTTPRAIATPTQTATSTGTPAPTATLVPSPTATTQPITFYRAPALSEPSGPRADGTAVLPNGRVVSPTGRQATVATFPTNLRVGPTGHLFVTNDGHKNPDEHRYLQVIDPQTLQVQRTPSQHVFGLAVHPNGQQVYVANGPADRVDVFAFDGATLSAMDGASITLPPHTFPLGIELSADGNLLYVVGFLSNTFWRVDLRSGTMQQASVKIGNFPYAVVLGRDGTRAYVSSWGISNGNNVQPSTNVLPAPLPPTDPNNAARSSVAVLDISGAASPTLVQYVPIARDVKFDPKQSIYGGSHPSTMALSPDGSLLYVAATNVDRLAVVETASNREVALIDLNSFGDGLQGLYPSAVAVSHDGTRLYVTDAGINAVQVIDADQAAHQFTPRGYIPTGWYPSAIALSADDQTLYVASAKGLNVGGNGGDLVDISQVSLNNTAYYIGGIINGQVSAIDLASVDLDAGTAAVRANNGFDPVSLTPAERAQLADNPVPIEFGSTASAQIKYVVYILKENRTYDQVLGDLPEGRGDPRLTLFGEDVTPNAHALARQFAMGDNFYNDAEVSYPGHEWITQGNNNDWVEKIWPIEYNGLLQTSYNIESGQEGFTQNGYIFEALERQHVPYRVYGETLAFNSRFTAGLNNGGSATTLHALQNAFGSIGNLVDHIGDLLAGDLDALRAAGVDVDILQNVVWPNLLLSYPANILADKTDVHRAEMFTAELAQFTANNTLPNFLFIWLPNDHTFGAKPRNPTPRSAVADNDQGLGMVVDALTKSPFWPHMAIFVSEDDAQDGQDHISAHRTISLVMSPYAKRGYVSGVHSSNVGMLKTMELLLGVEPMSQYDRYATDMRDYFTTTPDLTPFTALPARIRPEENPAVQDAPNPMLREAAEVSEEINLSEYDEAGPELSRVLWLVHVGQRIEGQRRLAVLATTAIPVLLIGAGWVLQRRRRQPELARADR